MKFIFAHPILSSVDTGQVRIQRSSGQGYRSKSQKVYYRNVKFRSAITPVLKNNSHEVCVQRRVFGYGGSNGVTAIFVFMSLVTTIDHAWINARIRGWSALECSLVCSVSSGIFYFAVNVQRSTEQNSVSEQRVQERWWLFSSTSGQWWQSSYNLQHWHQMCCFQRRNQSVVGGGSWPFDNSLQSRFHQQRWQRGYAISYALLFAHMV